MTADCAEISLWFTAVCVSVSLSGVHIYQMMYGCEWDDETGHVLNGFICIGYDEEGFISFDPETGTWITLKQEAEITKLEWDTNKVKTIRLKHYLNQRCPDYLEKFMIYGRNSLMRTGRITWPDVVS